MSKRLEKSTKSSWLSTWMKKIIWPKKCIELRKIMRQGCMTLNKRMRKCLNNIRSGLKTQFRLWEETWLTNKLNLVRLSRKKIIFKNNVKNYASIIKFWRRKLSSWSQKIDKQTRRLNICCTTLKSTKKSFRKRTLQSQFTKRESMICKSQTKFWNTESSSLKVKQSHNPNRMKNSNKT